MAQQLPPKFPSSISSIPPASSWADEFFDFTSCKRGSHRRAISDSVTFAGPRDATHAVAAAASFDRLDEEQLISMFAPPSTAPSTPSSDRNSMSDQDKQTPPNSSGYDLYEAQSASINAETPLAAAAVSAPITPQTFVDSKRVRRILANRQSAQRSRVRKLQYISDLENSVTSLESEVSALSPRVAFLDHQRSVLSVGNSQLKQRIAALAQDKIFKDAHQEALQHELERLRQVYHRQNLKKMAVVAGIKSDGPVLDCDKKFNIPAGTAHDLSSGC